MLGSAHRKSSPIWKRQGPERSTVPLPSPSIVTMEGVGEVCGCAKRRWSPKSRSISGNIASDRRMRIWNALYVRPVAVKQPISRKADRYLGSLQLYEPLDPHNVFRQTRSSSTRSPSLKVQYPTSEKP